jgi:hypothetical protein
MQLTAFHETTRQPRTNISLTRASKLIDDKSSLVKPDEPAKGKGRRKSGFAEEDQAYMFVEEGFRIRFANGETIDFYADSTAEKEGWMKVLSGLIGKDATAGSKSWCDHVLHHERSLKNRAEHATKARPRSQGQAEMPVPFSASKSQPASPVKGRDLQSQRQVEITAPTEPRTNSRRAQIKSMIF